MDIILINLLHIILCGAVESARVDGDCSCQWGIGELLTHSGVDITRMIAKNLSQ